MPQGDDQNVQARHIPLDRLISETVRLQSLTDRTHQEYIAISLGLVKLLNGYQRGSVTNFDTRQLRAQTGHFLLVNLRGISNPVPLDLAYLDRLKSHFKNPAILVLRRIRKYLMPYHRKLLADMERDQVEERRLDLVNLDVNKHIRTSMDTMQRFEAMAELTGTVTRKLDILAKAANAPARAKWDFELLENIFEDQHHLRSEQAGEWLKRSVFQGNKKVLDKTINGGIDMMDRRSERIYTRLEALTGIPFDREAATPGSIDWYALAARLKRDEDFIRVFDAEDKIFSRLRRHSFHTVQAAYNADKFKKLLLDQLEDQEDKQHQLDKLSEIYFELDTCIENSLGANAEGESAIRTDKASGRLTDDESEAALAWVQKNKTRLQSMRLETFRKITELAENNPELITPERIQHLIEQDQEIEEEPLNAEGLLPLIPIRELRAELVKISADLEAEAFEKLKRYHALERKIISWIAFIADLEIHQQIYKGCSGYRQFEEELEKLDDMEGQLINLRRNCTARLVETFREADYTELDREMIDDCLAATVDAMLESLRELEYGVIQVDHYRKIFERTPELKKAAVVHLDVLFSLVHAVPGQVQLFAALNDWEKELQPKILAEKQNFIIDNEFKLQELIDDIRAALRELMSDGCPFTRRLRFDVFGLADCYAGGLRLLLEGQMRRAERLVTLEDAEHLLEQVQAVEAQVIEAQRITRPGGDAEERLGQLQKNELISSAFGAMLSEDLKENFADLDGLLTDINQSLRRIREFQNRKGGDHETDLFNLTINLNDYEQLKRIYTFVDNISMMDLKRFGITYKARNKLMDEVFTKGLRNHESIPPEVARLITRKIYKAYGENKNIPVDLKIAILYNMPEIMEAESRLLMRTLNFSAHKHIHEKSIYQAQLQILERARKSSDEQLTALRGIWNSYLHRMKQFKPSNYTQNYELNSARLKKDGNEAASGRL